MGGSILYRNIKIWLFHKVGKSQIKVGVAEEIGVGNKIGQGNGLRQKLNNFLHLKSLVLGGWVEVKAILRLAYSNKKQIVNGMHY